MCAVFKPSSHSPNLQEIDTTKSNEFSCIVNTTGENIQAYKLTILSEKGDEVIANGHKEGQTYVSGAVNLSVPVANKKLLKVPNITQNFCESGHSFSNGKNYQWGIRTYNSKVSSSAQPNTKVCEGFLVGSTKNVVWSRIPKAQTDALNQIVYDRYIEFSVNSGNDLIIGAHESKEKVKPTSFPYIQRKKIDWVTKELGNDTDFVKIETTEDFDYDYLDGQQYSIYQCSSDHTVNSLYADPNSNVNVANFIIVYKTLADAQAARSAGETPGDIKSTSRWSLCMVRTDGTSGYNARKITGYSSDTGEMRFNDSFSIAPKNGECYRLFEFDVSTEEYVPIDDTVISGYDPLSAHLVGGVAITNSTYYKTVTNHWDMSGENQVHRLFIQPNINIKSDTTNPNELVFANGIRINIVEQYWINGEQNNQRVDVTFNKLDNSQWLLEDNSKNISGQYLNVEGAPQGAVVPTISQTDYIVYTDFTDSMPYNIIYARQEPNIHLMYRNAIKPIIAGNLINGVFYIEGVELTEPSGMNLYLDVNVSSNTLTYYKWVNSEDTGSYVMVPSYLVEGTYDSTNDIFKDKNGNTITGNSRCLYYDTIGKKYYTYSSTVSPLGKYYTTTENTEVIWVEVNSPIARDYREVEFKAIWTLDNSPIIQEPIIATNPQIKSYKYTLSAYTPASQAIPVLVKTSKIYYTVDTLWTFRGLDGTQTSYYSADNPHKYNIEIEIIDEYDKQYLQNADFYIYYSTENSPSSIEINLLCDEQANQVNANLPSFAESTDYGSFETVTNSNIDADNGCVIIPEGYTLNYTSSTNGIPLNFPREFSYLTKINITEGFVEENNLPMSVDLCTIGHGTETITSTIASNSIFYSTNVSAGATYYLDSSFAISGGQLASSRPYMPHIEGQATYGTLTLSDVDTNMYYINMAAEGIGRHSHNDTISDRDTGVTITTINEQYSQVVLENSIGEIGAGTYYVFNKDIVATENKEEYVFRVNVGPAYYKNPEDGKIYKNEDCQHLTLHEIIREPGSTSDIQLVECFEVDGDMQDYIDLADPTLSSLTPREISPLFAIQSKGNDYIIANEGLPTISLADTTKKYVLTKDTYQFNKIYSAGVYHVASYSGGIKKWELVIDEEYIYLTNTNLLAAEEGEAEATYDDLNVPTLARPNIVDGTKVAGSNVQWKIGQTTYTLTDKEHPIVSGVSNTYHVYHDTSSSKYYSWDGTTLAEITAYTNTKGQINYGDDNTILSSDYIWLDSGMGQTAFKDYIKNKMLYIFLTVKYDEDGDRILKSQVKITNIDT